MDEIRQTIENLQLRELLIGERYTAAAQATLTLVPV